MTRSTKLLAGLLSCALGSAFAAASLDGQVAAKSETVITAADCEGRVLPRTGTWTIWAEQMQGLQLPGMRTGGSGTLTITNVSECGRKIDVNMPKVGGEIVFELVGEWKVPALDPFEPLQSWEVFDKELDISSEEFWEIVKTLRERLKEAKSELRLLTHRATDFPDNFQGVQWLLVVQSETQIRSLIYGGLNWQHHSWDYQGQ